MSAHPADAPGVWILATRARMTGSRGPHPQHPPAPLAPRPTSPVVILGLVPRIQTPGPDTGAPCGHTERMDPRHKGEDDGKSGATSSAPAGSTRPARPASPVVILRPVPRIQTPGPDALAPCGHTGRMDPRHKGEDDGKLGANSSYQRRLPRQLQLPAEFAHGFTSPLRDHIGRIYCVPFSLIINALRPAPDFGGKLLALPV